ncbi:alpha/beta hydrolase (plasmid) [Rhodococcus opacus]|uniref:alpha/beta hydrolase n=1 Tax=Rhodococcus opacus TaxID=37919 RepID=UPI0034D27FC3
MTLHPFFAAVVARNAGGPSLSSGPPARAREMVSAGRAALGAGPQMADVEEISITTRGGALSARLLVPDGEVAGVVVYFHGGGWVVGSIDDFDTLGRELAKRSRCAVLLPEYRLAPEHPFPAALEDAEDAIIWAAESLLRRFGSSAPIVVAGDSAGGNLATVAIRRLRRRVDVALQVLVYPVTNANFDTPSYLDSSDGMPLTRDDMKWFFSLYAPAQFWPEADIAPIRSASLSGLPRTVVITAEHDVLRSDGELYARALQEAGVDVAYRQYPGTVHGFLRLHNHVDTSSQALSDIADAISDAIYIQA